MEITTTTQSLELFKTALLGQNYSPKTLRAYSDDLKQFMQWVGENRIDWDHPRRFTRADVEGFMSYLAGQQMTGVTRVRKLAAIRKFHIPSDLVVDSWAHMLRAAQPVMSR